MSYSFGLKAATKAAAIAEISKQLDAVVAAQPVHAADRAQAQAASEAFVNLLPDDDAQDVGASISGWIQTTDGGLVQASVGVTVGLQKREA